ncbi:phosphatase PAP2 family protein [Paenibacillus sp. 481]|nr:phosphatase PAP2 family protein [Paenibacillus sp. 481]
MTRGVLKNSFSEFDIAVTDTLRSFASPQLTEIVTFITHFASSHIIAPIAIIVAATLAFGFKKQWDALCVAVVIGGSALLNEGLKLIFQRARPEWEHWVHATGYSYPSGHSMTGLAFYGMVGFLIWLHLKERGKVRFYVPILTLLLIGGIGVSRIYLGVHYVTDVIAGFAAGMVWLIACIYGMQWLKGRKHTLNVSK